MTMDTVTKKMRGIWYIMVSGVSFPNSHCLSTSNKKQEKILMTFNKGVVINL